MWSKGLRAGLDTAEQCGLCSRFWKAPGTAPGHFPIRRARPSGRTLPGEGAGQRLGVGCEVAVEVEILELIVDVSELVGLEKEKFLWSVRG